MRKIPFTKESVKEYLDACIEKYYVDAYQSIRTLLFDELFFFELPDEYVALLDKKDE